MSAFERTLKTSISYRIVSYRIVTLLGEADAAVASVADSQLTVCVELGEAAERPHWKHVAVRLVVDCTRLVEHAHHLLLNITSRHHAQNDVGMARLRSTSWTAAHRSLMLSAGSVSGQPHSN